MNQQPTTNNQSLLFLSKAITSLFGFGYFWPFPATWGSAAAGIALYFFWPELSVAIKLAIIMATFLLGTYLAGIIERAENTHDPRFVVIDEAVGMMIATFLLHQIWWQWVLGFFLFRIFDILKPWPASWINDAKGGFSIMGDDVIAGVYTLAILKFAMLY